MPMCIESFVKRIAVAAALLWLMADVTVHTGAQPLPRGPRATVEPRPAATAPPTVLPVTAAPAAEIDAASRSVTLRDLLLIAYAPQRIHATGQLVGLPDWGVSIRYPWSLPGGDPGEDWWPLAEARSAVVRRQLVERFGLRVHQETRVARVYDLVRVDAERLGPRLTPSVCARRLAAIARARHGRDTRLQCPPTRFAAEGVVSGVTMPDLAAVLSTASLMDRLVRDRTGLVEEFELQLEWAGWRFGAPVAGVAAAATHDQASVVRALEAQLGLTLVEVTARIPVLVIDAVSPAHANDPDPSPDARR
jgi:uncharacterized protein (TIGR03435 family)